MVVNWPISGEGAQDLGEEGTKVLVYLQSMLLIHYHVVSEKPCEKELNFTTKKIEAGRGKIVCQNDAKSHFQRIKGNQSLSAYPIPHIPCLCPTVCSPVLSHSVVSDSLLPHGL